MTDALTEQNKKWLEAHQEISFAMEFPPFSADITKKEEFMDAVLAYTSDYMKKFKDAKESGDSKGMEKEVPFADIEKKYSAELEEARLYLKRYGWSPEGKASALKAYKNDSDK
jgi:hypothetical protein